jgi:hypothetical protein
MLTRLIYSMVFQWLAIPMLQWELDSYVTLHNTTRHHANRQKVLPHSVPDLMFENLESIGAQDYKVLAV